MSVAVQFELSSPDPTATNNSAAAAIGVVLEALLADKSATGAVNALPTLRAAVARSVSTNADAGFAYLLRAVRCTGGTVTLAALCGDVGGGGDTPTPTPVVVIGDGSGGGGGGGSDSDDADSTVLIIVLIVCVVAVRRY